MSGGSTDGPVQEGLRFIRGRGKGGKNQKNPLGKGNAKARFQ